MDPATPSLMPPKDVQPAGKKHGDDMATRRNGKYKCKVQLSLGTKE